MCAPFVAAESAPLAGAAGARSAEAEAGGCPASAGSNACCCCFACTFCFFAFFLPARPAWRGRQQSSLQHVLQRVLWHAQGATSVAVPTRHCLTPSTPQAATVYQRRRILRPAVAGGCRSTALAYATASLGKLMALWVSQGAHPRMNKARRACRERNVRSTAPMRQQPPAATPHFSGAFACSPSKRSVQHLWARGWTAAARGTCRRARRSRAPCSSQCRWS